MNEYDAKLKEICEGRAHSLYGENLPEEIASRMEYEGRAIGEQGYAELFLALHETAKRPENRPIIAASCTGASFVAFLLGFSEADPLSAHGGFGIAKETFFGTPENPVPFRIHIGAADDQKILDGLQKYLGEGRIVKMKDFDGEKTPQRVGRGKYIVLPRGQRFEETKKRPAPKDLHGKTGETGPVVITVTGSETGYILSRLYERTGMDQSAVPVGTAEVLDFIKSGKCPENVSFFGEPEYRALVKITDPQNISDLAHVMGYACGTYDWDKAACDEETALWRGRIGTRDDVINFLCEYGVPSEEAYKISENIRLGKGVSEVPRKMLESCGVPAWFIHRADKVRYLFPKAHCASFVIAQCRLIWFYLHYPKEYEQAAEESEHIKTTSETY